MTKKDLEIVGNLSKRQRLAAHVAHGLKILNEHGDAHLLEQQKNFERCSHELQKELDAAREHLRQKINATSLSPLQKNILISRYVDLLPFRAVAKKVSYSETQVHRIRRKIFEKLEGGE